ncbi:MAG: hypothetical protein B7733_05300 [Myxococcales bacterium FL481]|nr:MAG: hypothetical protein B7733_05300 [Myxococcales bacterium FL481]
MASIVCYLQRTPSGLHPASELALCLARDLGSGRGAAVVGVTSGDGSKQDESVITAAGRHGADQVLFAGPSGLAALYRRLRPRHVMVPWSTAGKRALGPASLRVTAPSWITGPVATNVELAPVLAIVAGTLAWVDIEEPTVCAEYEDDFREAESLPWNEDEATAQSPLVYVAPGDIADQTRATLAACGAMPVTPDYARHHERGTLLWFDAGPAGLPAQLETRGAQARVVLLPGPMAQTDAAWSRADWVLPGAWPEAVQQLTATSWRNALTR